VVCMCMYVCMCVCTRMRVHPGRGTDLVCKHSPGPGQWVSGHSLHPRGLGLCATLPANLQ